MAKITDGTFRNWNDSEIIDAAEYKRERDILKVANNDNDERISSIEESVVGFQLDTAQLQKITDNEGGVKVAVTSTFDDILLRLVQAGKGFHTFYAISGAVNLPPSKLSIRGIAHITGVDPTYGYVKAIDYEGREYNNYINNGTWTGWKETLGLRDTSILNTVNVVENGFYRVNPDSTSAPSSNPGTLQVLSFWEQTTLTQLFIDEATGHSYTRCRSNNVWQPWRRNITEDEAQEQLWSNSQGYYMHATQTVVPTKKLSQCRNGWILVWSDYSTGGGADNFDISYSYIPKGTPFKNGHSHLFTVPNYLSGTTLHSTVKKLDVFDTKLVGHTDNDESATQSNDVVLRYVLEW